MFISLHTIVLSIKMCKMAFASFLLTVAKLFSFDEENLCKLTNHRECLYFPIFLLLPLGGAGPQDYFSDENIVTFCSLWKF